MEAKEENDLLTPYGQWMFIKSKDRYIQKQQPMLYYLVDAIKQTLVEQGFSQPVKEYEEKLLSVGTKVRYLYEPGELEGQQYGGERRKRSTDPIWSVDVYKIKDRYVQKQQPTLYYSDGGPKQFLFSKSYSPFWILSY